LKAVGIDCAALRLLGVFEAGERAHTELRDAQGRVHKVHAFPIFEDDRVESVVIRCQDVTAERELEDRLIQSEKMASVGQLAAGVAHEINNPVGFILSNLNRLAEYAEELAALWKEFGSSARVVREGERSLSEVWEEMLKACAEVDLDFLVADLTDVVAECREGADRIRKIVRDLKTFSHPDTGDGEYADLNMGIEGTLNIVWNELKYKCEVEKDLGAIPKVLCRPQQLNQVFMNMLVNAAQAIPEKGKVTVRTRADGNRVLVSISDTGMGIAPENRDRIFDPFFTTKPVGEGTGLGLHLAAGIIRNHGGEIRLHSVRGEGSTFTVVLPIAPPEGFRPAPEATVHSLDRMEKT
jgi:signal transduction histidine kinase